MEHKKDTKAQLEKSIKNAQVFVKKAQKRIYFGDNGIGIYICPDKVVSSTNFHTHVWEKIDSTGYDQTCINLEMVVDIANEHLDEIKKKDDKGNEYYSLEKLISLDSLSNSEKIIIQEFVRWSYVINSSVHSFCLDQITIACNSLKYIAWHALLNSMFSIGEIEKLTYYDLINDYMFYEAYFLSGEGIDNEKIEETKKQCHDIIKNALNDIREINIKNGAKNNNFLFLKKTENDEAEDLDKLQH